MGFSRLVSAWRELRRVKRVGKSIHLTNNAFVVLEGDMRPETLLAFKILSDELEIEMQGPFARALIESKEG